MRLMILTVVACVAALAGCTSFSAAPHGRHAQTPPPEMHPDAWPKRDVERVQLIMAATPTEVYRFQFDGSREASEMRPEDVAAAILPVARVDFNEVVGQGVLRVFGGPTGIDDFGRFGPSARFVSSWYLENPRRDELGTSAAVYEERGNRLLSVTRPGLRYADPSVRDLTDEGVSIAVPPRPTSPTAPRARGLLVYLSGTLSPEEERPLLDTLETRGWAIMRIGTVEPAPVGEAVAVVTPGEITRAAAAVAERIDHSLAENAYAVEAALEYCAAHRPDLPTRPLILVGSGAGAMALPAVAVRLGDRVDAAILIGGGANMLDVSQRSERHNMGIALDWGTRFTPSDRYTELLVQYLASSRLDPYHMAPYLVDRPVLVVHAVFDSVVPASAGLLLYERLGNPDRLRFTGGHKALLYFMTDTAPKIATWLDRALHERSRLRPAVPRRIVEDLPDGPAAVRAGSVGAE